MMEGKRRDNSRRSQNRKPPRGCWQPRVPAWEKEFCKVVGSMDWEILLQMKKYLHLYNNVMEWNDSAGEEAFNNAKKRYWAQKNSLSCDILLPDPDLYIDNINWDSDTDLDHELLSDVESLPMSSRTEVDHNHVVIFGESATPTQDVAAIIGWGDDENVVAPATCSSANYADLRGHSSIEWGPHVWPGYPNDGWQGYSNDAWQYSNENGQMSWGSDWNNWSWDCANSCYNYPRVEPEIRDTWGDGNRMHWNDYNNTMTGSGGYVPSYKTSRVQGDEHQRTHDRAPYERSSTREWNSSSIAVGQTWDRWE